MRHYASNEKTINHASKKSQNLPATTKYRPVGLYLILLVLYAKYTVHRVIAPGVIGRVCHRLM